MISWLQHVTSPVEQVLTEVAVGAATVTVTVSVGTCVVVTPHGVATARREREDIITRVLETRENILSGAEGLLQLNAAGKSCLN